jgi:phenylacetate-CoA ligase
MLENNGFTDNFENALLEIEYAFENISFFRDHMNQAGLTPDDIKSPEDFLKIPPTTKRHYRKNFPLGTLAKGITLKDPALYRTQSSGTSGERLISVEYGFIFLERAINSISVNPDLFSAFTSEPRKHCIYSAPNCSDVECSNPNSTMENRTLQDGSLVLSVYHDLLTTPDKIYTQNLEEIDIYKPELFYTDPTHLGQLSKKMTEFKYTPPQVPVILTFTQSNQLNKKHILKSFKQNSNLARVMSMTEFGFIAVECPMKRMHANTSSYYLEFIVNGKPAKKGELAELYITSYYQGCMPHIRYKTGDLYRVLDEKCECGHEFPVVEIEGRISNMFFRDNSIILTPNELDQIVGAPDWLELYKLHQSDNDFFTFSYIKNENYEQGSENDIKKELIRCLGEKVTINFENVPYIPSARGGKYQFCSSNVGEQLLNEGFSL